MTTIRYSFNLPLDKNAKKPDVREKLLQNGVNSLNNQELAMVLLGSGIANMPVQQLAMRVLKVVQTARSETIIDEFLKIKGIGESKACLLSAALELGKRLYASIGQKIQSPLDILPLIKHYSLQNQEHFLCILLNGAQEVLSIKTVSVGTINYALIHPREVFADALKERAAGVIVSHNHPSGNVEPSKNDVDVTRRLLKVSQIIGINLLDHIIISQTDYFSFVEHKLVFREITSV